MPANHYGTKGYTGHIEGCSYFSAYWRESYTATQLHDDGSVTVVWHGDNQCGARQPVRSTRHMTPVGHDKQTSPKGWGCVEA